MKQKKRNKIFERFMKKNSGILISTDLIARGLDFMDVNYILQIDPPQVFFFFHYYDLFSIGSQFFYSQNRKNS